MVGKFALLAAAGMVLAQPASAATKVFTLSAVDSSAGLGSGPFGTVTVTESGGSLLFSETLAAGYRIHDGNANHNAFTFSILGDPAVTISNLTSGFAAINTSAGTTVSAPPFGDFATGIDCSTACGPGYNGGYTGTLSFTVSAATALSLASLGFNTVGANQIFFTTDVVNANGATGNVGAVAAAVTAVPEPASWALMLLGFAGIGCVARRQRVSARVGIA